MAFLTSKQIKEAIASKLRAGSGVGANVVKRWKFAFRAKDWNSMLRDLSDKGKVNGWYITRVAARNKKLGHNHWEYEWTYSLWYFRSYNDVESIGKSSEDVFDEIIDACVAEFEASPTLGFDAMNDGFDQHTELQVINCDIVDQKVHVAQCQLTVKLTKQP